LSVSRVGSAAQIKTYSKVAGRVKLELAQYRELAAFAQFGSDLDARTKAQLERGARVVELFKQPALAPKSTEVQIVLLWAVQNGIFDAIAREKIVAAGVSLDEYLTTRKTALLKRVLTEGKLSDGLVAEFKSTCEDWARTFS
jgi:F-type H+-transporting ATPase subunit alpha